jgi:RecT family
MSDTPNAVVPVKDKKIEVTHFDANEPSSLFMVTGVFEQLQRVANLMASSSLVPKHLQGQVADCFLVVSQAMQWKMNPFAVAQSCYVLQGKVGYEGKLIAAVVNANPALKTKLNYEYSGSGLDRKVRVFGTLRGETEPREVDGTVKQWQTPNKQWQTLTDQMLSYRGAREWARRHMPEAVLGVYADEELPQVVAQAPSRTVEVVTDSLDDFGVVVEASNDPKTAERKPEPPVEAELVQPKAAKQPAPPAPEPGVIGEELSPEDAEINKLFGGR